MEAKELRIGNLVYWDGKHEKYCVYSVTLITKDDLTLSGWDEIYTSSDLIEPIPLTEEWLVKFGFDWTESGWFYIEECKYGDKGVFTLRISKYKKDSYTWFDGGAMPILNYVHQLQNLYFALTGEELKHE